MANVGLGKSRRIKGLAQYLGDVALYDLSRAVKRGKESYKFVVVARGRKVSGGDGTSIFPSDENGKVLSSTPLLLSKATTVAAALKEFGFQLV